MIIYISDFSLARGGDPLSGYATIGVRLCTELSKTRDVLALGIGYDRVEHNYNFRIVQIDNLKQIGAMVNQILAAGAHIEAVVVALDVPIQQKLVELSTGEIPYIGLFPLESPPLSMSWATSLRKMDRRIVMSEFAKAELAKQGLDSDFMPIGVGDIDFWRRDGIDTAKVRRRYGIDEDEFLVLTVADNQERKNLSRAIEIFARFAIKPETGTMDKSGYLFQPESRVKARYIMVTRIDTPVGYDLNDLAMRNGVADRMIYIERGVPAEELRDLYAAADAFLLTSKAEGLAIPMLEAMAMGCPTVATHCTAMMEHMDKSGSGIGISVDYIMVDPFGNGERYMANAADGGYSLDYIKSEDEKEYHSDLAREYVKGRDWPRAASVLNNAIEEVLNG